MKYNIEKIIALNPLPVWLERYGIEVDRKGFARCPFHNEKTASFKVYPNNKFYCFGCGAAGSVIDLVRRMENLDFSGACERLDGDISYSRQRRLSKLKREREKAAQKRSEAEDEYFNALDLLEANEKIIKDLKPTSPNDVPDGVWLYALNMRSLLQYYLEIAETNYLKGGG